MMLSRLTVVTVAVLFALAGCGKSPLGASAAGKTAAAGPRLLIAPEDLLTLQTNALASGPVITGSVQPERNADLRAELSALVLQVLKENGERVHRGDALLRLDETAIRDSMNSAEQASRAASQSLDQATRMLARQQTLRASGMASAQALEDAEIRRNNAQSELAAATTRAVQARQQLQRTVVRAPFDGIVSERKVSNGDTAQVGKELIRVIDPDSMRFEGLVSADKIGVVKVGQTVRFRINGYAGQDFAGRVRRIDAAANPVTRQVAVLVDFAGGARQPGVAGLYAEGQIESDSVAALMIAEGALVRAGDKAYAWRVRDGHLNRVALTVGLRDPRSGQWQVLAGLSAGEQVLRSAGAGFKDGQQIELASPKASAVAAGRRN